MCLLFPLEPIGIGIFLLELVSLEGGQLVEHKLQSCGVELAMLVDVAA